MESIAVKRVDPSWKYASSPAERPGSGAPAFVAPLRTPGSVAAPPRAFTVGVGPVDTSKSEPAETAAQHKQVRNPLRIFCTPRGSMGQTQCGKKAYGGAIAIAT